MPRRRQRRRAALGPAAGEAEGSEDEREAEALHARLADGLYTWGGGQYGKLGHGDMKDRRHPARVDAFDGHKVVAMACGSFISAAVTSTNHVYTWGSRGHGALGHLGCNTDVTIPRRVDRLVGVKVVQIACGASHVAAVTSTGAVYTWGRGREGALGTLSVGDLHDVWTPKQVSGFFQQDSNRTGVTWLGQAAGVACGDDHTVVWCTSGAVYVFGSNSDGQIGLGERGRAVLPTHLDAFGDARVVAAACGARHSCFATADGALFVTGSNTRGQLTGDTTLVLRPRQAQISNKVRAVSCGAEHTVLLAVGSDPSILEVYVAGSNRYGQLGMLRCGPNACLRSWRCPTALKDEKIIGIAAGAAHTLFIAKSGLLAVGRMTGGALGFKETVPEPSHRDQDWTSLVRRVHRVDRRTRIAQVAAGAFHSAMIVDESASAAATNDAAASAAVAAAEAAVQPADVKPSDVPPAAAVLDILPYPIPASARQGSARALDVAQVLQQVQDLRAALTGMLPLSEALEAAIPARSQYREEAAAVDIALQAPVQQYREFAELQDKVRACATAVAASSAVAGKQDDTQLLQQRQQLDQHLVQRDAIVKDALSAWTGVADKATRRSLLVQQRRQYLTDMKNKIDATIAPLDKLLALLPTSVEQWPAARDSIGVADNELCNAATETEEAALAWLMELGGYTADAEQEKAAAAAERDSAAVELTPDQCAAVRVWVDRLVDPIAQREDERAAWRVRSAAAAERRRARAAEAAIEWREMTPVQQRVRMWVEAWWIPLVAGAEAIEKDHAWAARMQARADKEAQALAKEAKAAEDAQKAKDEAETAELRRKIFLSLYSMYSALIASRFTAGIVSNATIEELRTISSNRSEIGKRVQSISQEILEGWSVRRFRDYSLRELDAGANTDPPPGGGGDEDAAASSETGAAQREAQQFDAAHTLPATEVAAAIAWQDAQEKEQAAVPDEKQRAAMLKRIEDVYKAVEKIRKLTSLLRDWHKAYEQGIAPAAQRTDAAITELQAALAEEQRVVQKYGRVMLTGTHLGTELREAGRTLRGVASDELSLLGEDAEALLRDCKERVAALAQVTSEQVEITELRGQYEQLRADSKAAQRQLIQANAAAEMARIDEDASALAAAQALVPVAQKQLQHCRSEQSRLMTRLSQLAAQHHPELIADVDSEIRSAVASTGLIEHARLSDFEQICMLSAGVGNSHIMLVRRDGDISVLKEVAVSDEPSRRRFENEVRVVHRLSHPSIAEIMACFYDGLRAYIRMPLYPRGTLRQWAMSSPDDPPASLMQRVRAYDEAKVASASATTVVTDGAAAASDDSASSSGSSSSSSSPPRRDNSTAAGSEGGDAAEGASLKRERSRRPAWELQEVFRQLLQGIAYMHDRGITHRDLKPENVLMTEDWRPVICDFGISKDVTGDAVSAHTMHGAGVVLGTEGYLAPEVLEGGRPGPAADCFAVGTMLYEFLFGKLPMLVPDLVIPEAGFSPDGKRIDVADSLQCLLRGLLCVNPRDRWSAKQALACDYFVTSHAKVLAENQQIMQSDKKIELLREHLSTIGDRYNTTEFTVDRAHIVSSVIKVVSSWDDKQLLNRGEVSFQDEVGIDDGGLTSDLWVSFWERVVQPDLGYFVSASVADAPPSGVSYLPNRKCAKLSDLYTIGTCLARSIVDRVPIAVQLAPSFYRFLLYQEPTLADLEQYDRTLALSLRDVLTTSCVEDYCMTFEGLRSDGAAVDVTEQNREEFVRLKVAKALVDDCRQQLTEIRSGFERVRMGSFLQLFTPTELMLLVSGNQHIDAEMIIRCLDYSDYLDENPDSPTPKMLENVLRRMSPLNLRRFLRLLSSQCSIPASGMRILISYARRSENLPAGHTCYNQLDVPDYADEAKLEEKLLLACASLDGDGLGFHTE